MRKAFLAALALSPVLLHAQANSPAQLESKLAAPAAIGASDHGTSSAKPLRVSTGVEIPKLIHSVSVSSDNTWPWAVTGINKTVVVGMVVDPNGVPTDLKIVRSVGPELGKNVLEAVAQYRFKPGTVSKQPVAFPVNLEIDLLSPAR
ncbi:energy transducer TonB [Edaphobacter aggregans]|uniref:energy transducer TonB n=1 Tax=Edaphobacter aggregans TaxID=570835 RepID=UPI000552A5F8|nr:energy transducer TonB [Edaphobacter aggregans]